MFNSIKRAFGFSEKSYTDFEEPAVEDVPEVVHEPVKTTPVAEHPEVKIELADEFLDSILAVLNANLPPLVSEAIDSERQRAKLTELLGPSLIDFAEKMRVNATRELSSDRDKMKSELESLRSQKKDFASKRDAHKATLLSEQRQRRALAERNRDLEAKIDELHSEIEQHKLTISSLMNKIRVSEVNEGELDSVKAAFEHQIEGLKEKLQKAEAENVELASKVAELEAPEALKKALEQRREIVEASNPPAPKPKKQRKPRKPKKTEVQAKTDEQLKEMEMVDFLVPGAESAAPIVPEPNPDFGYQPPKRNPEPDIDIQLTLF